MNKETEIKVPRLMTIRETAKTGILPENRLRQMQHQGKLPGIYSGNKFFVNFEMLVQLVEQECRANAGIGKGENE